jgi:hypothetical protein
MKLGKTFIVALLLTVFSLSACSNGASVPDDGPGGGGIGGSGGLFPTGMICSFNEHAEGELCICNDGYELDADGNCVAAGGGGESCNANEHAQDGDCICDGGFKRDAHGDCVAENNSGESCGSHETTDASGDCLCDDGYKLDSQGECAKKYKIAGVRISPDTVSPSLVNEPYSVELLVEPANKYTLRGKKLVYSWSSAGVLPVGLKFGVNESSKYVLSGAPELVGSFKFSVRACISIDGSDLDSVCDTAEYDLVIAEDIALEAVVRTKVADKMKQGECDSPSTLQSLAYCNEGDGANVDDKKLKVVGGLVGDDVMTWVGERLVVVAKATSEKLEWNVESENGNALLEEVGEGDFNERMIASSDENGLGDVVVTVTDGFGSRSTISFSSIEFNDTPPKLVLESKKERLVSELLFAGVIGYGGDGKDGYLVECPGANQVITGYSWKSGQMSDWDRGEHVIKSISFVCKDINDLDSLEEQSPALNDGLWPGIAAADEYSFWNDAGVATGIHFSFGWHSTASVVGVDLYGATLDSRFEDNLLMGYGAPLSVLVQAFYAPAKVAWCDKGEVLTGIRAHVGPWYKSTAIFGASHIQCHKVSVASE